MKHEDIAYFETVSGAQHDLCIKVRGRQNLMFHKHLYTFNTEGASYPLLVPTKMDLKEKNDPCCDHVQSSCAEMNTV